MATRGKVFVIHENEDWLPPLRVALTALGTPFEEWLLDRQVLDLAAVPPEGVFFSRMSASCFTRGHWHATQSAEIVLRWLEAHHRRVVNGSAVLRLEVNKAAQQVALQQAGIATPKTVVAVGRDKVMEAARALGVSPIIIKPNQGGKGIGVEYFASIDDLAGAAAADQLPSSVDNVWLVQERIASMQDFITRLEFVGGRFLYAVRVFTGGSFALCPADVCEVDPERFRPANANGARSPQNPLPWFEVDHGFADPLIARLERLLANNGIEIAAVEFIRRADGTPVVYDINTNTNYNSAAESRAGLKAGGMQAIAEFLTRELNGLRQRPALATAV